MLYYDSIINYIKIVLYILTLYYLYTLYDAASVQSVLPVLISLSDEDSLLSFKSGSV